LNTTIFSLVHDLFLRGLPFPQPDRIVRIYGESRERELDHLPYSVPRFSHYRDGQSVCSVIAADNGQCVTLTGLGEAAQLSALAVTSNYFDVGAQTLDVLRVVIAQGMKPVLIGLVAGMAAALALGRLLAAQLYEISPHNPLLLATTGAILGVAALLACVLPARKASLLNPVQALRTD